MRDTTNPTGSWVFDSSVVECFPDMLSRSIPDLDLMRRTIREVAHAHNSKPGVIVDHGCSLGATLETLAGPNSELYGYDNSRPMVDAAQQQLGGSAQIELLDIANEAPVHPPADVTAFVLTLQFLNPADRQRVLAGALERSAPGGLLIVAEKIRGGGWLEDVLVNAYHGRKRANGYTEEQVNAKAESLRGVLRPRTAHQVEAEISGAGWHGVECVWRSLNFACWVAVRA